MHLPVLRAPEELSLYRAAEAGKTDAFLLRVSAIFAYKYERSLMSCNLVPLRTGHAGVQRHDKFHDGVKLDTARWRNPPLLKAARTTDMASLQRFPFKE
jgi:hypothetical protein